MHQRRVSSHRVKALKIKGKIKFLDFTAVSELIPLFEHWTEEKLIIGHNLVEVYIGHLLVYHSNQALKGTFNMR